MPISSARRFLLGLGLLILPVSGWAQQPAPHPFDPVGRWRFFHTDGKPFNARLMPDQSASTDFGSGERGIWRWEGQAVRVMYTDGWDDLLSLTANGGYVKAGWAPDADRCAAPSNRAAAEKVSGDPGPGL